MILKRQFFLGRFADTMQTCKGIFFFKRTFFAEGRPDGVRKYGKMRPKYRNIRPVWTCPSQKGLKNTHIFFSRPSVHLSKLFQGEWMCSNPVYILQKCRNVQMFARLPPHLIVKSRQRFDISTRIVDPKLFSHSKF